MFPLPINQAPYYNTDPIANEIAADAMFDCYLEPVPGVGFVTRPRPWLLSFTDLQTGCQGDGIFWWDAANRCIAVSGGQIFDVREDGTYTDITGSTCTPGVPVVFADGQNLNTDPWLYMASGGLVYTVDGGATQKSTDGNAPKATHVAYIDGRFIASQPDSPRWLTTDTNPDTGNMENDFWSSTVNPFRNTARGDNLKALLTCWEEVYAWGSGCLEVWLNDFVTPFTPIPGAMSEIGLEAPYSVCRTENTLFALCVLDGKRVIVRMQGRLPVIVSEPIANLLSQMDKVSDAIGDLINVDGIAIYLLSFPSANQTWAYDHKNDTWSRWGHYTGEADSRDRFIGQHSCFCKAWNKHLIMSRKDGKIYELSRTIYDKSVETVLPYRQTGWISPICFGMATPSDHRKRCDQFYVKAKKGITDHPRLMMRYRDNGREEWSRWVEFNFQDDMIEYRNRQGTFRTRQYEFRIPEGLDTALVSASGTFMELKN
jgi:hypothetical protein